MSVIYWFSGTGNSLYAAKCLKDSLGDVSLYPMGSAVPQGVVGGEGEKIGFVFPSYGGSLPRIVRSFVEEIEIAPVTYIFTVVTMGGLGHSSISVLDSILKEKNLRLDYGKGIRMPANYVIAYNPSDKTKYNNRLPKITEKIRRASLDIAAGKKSVKEITPHIKILYKDIESLDAYFKVEDICTSCGLCADVCSLGNIRMENGKPQWQHKCEHCVACISWCPEQAIQFGKRTKARRRYQNPEIKVEELFVR